MKNKYNSYWKEQEGKYKNICNMKYKLLLYKFYLHVLCTSVIESFKTLSKSNINFLAFVFSRLDSYYQQYILKNVLSKINKNYLLQIYIHQLTNFLTKQDFKGVDICMKSFKLSGLINDIKLSKSKQIFRLTTLDGKTINFMPTNVPPEEVDKVNGHCHAAVEDVCIQLSKDEEIYAVSAIMKGAFDEPYYHSFVVWDTIVNDFAQNIIMKYDDYKELFKPKIIMSVEGKQMLKNIERLKEKEVDFKECNYCVVLKYAMHKQMKKERNIVNH